MTEIDTTFAIGKMRDIYTEMYARDKDPDSPFESRVQMAAWLREQLLSHPGSVAVLDIGAGARAVGKELLFSTDMTDDDALPDKLSESLMVSFDIADIETDRLSLGRLSLDALLGKNHLQADSRALPFKDDSFDIAISNLSIDMLRHQPGQFERATAEVARVLRPDGVVKFHFHPGTLFYELSDQYKEEEGAMKEYFHGIPDKNPFYSSSQEIVKDLGRAGLTVTDIAYESGYEGDWWAVEGKRIGPGTAKAAVQEAILAHLPYWPEGEISGESLSDIKFAMGMKDVSNSRFRNAVSGLAAGKKAIAWRRPSWQTQHVIRLNGSGISKRRPV